MGALHAGHAALIEAAHRHCDRSICSVFVNPMQFNDSKDFEHYPRREEQDIMTVEEAGADALFLPNVSPDGTSEIYPSTPHTYVDTDIHENSLESQFRPGHFRGVCTVVAKLFNIVQPTHAYFGQKDFMQTVVIRRMVEDLNFNVQIVVIPTVREDNGLAMSSRNARLSDNGRARAFRIYQALQAGQTKLHKEARSAPPGTLSSVNPETIKAAVQEVFDEDPEFKVEYISVADVRTGSELPSINLLEKPPGIRTLEPIPKKNVYPEEVVSAHHDSDLPFSLDPSCVLFGNRISVGVLSVAATLEGVRLIDNLPLSV